MKKAPKLPKTSPKSPKQPTLQFKFGVLVLALLTSIVISIIIFTTLSHMTERKNIEQKTLQYLKDKYKTDFAIKDAEYQAGGLGVDGDWVMTAYHPNDPKVVFTVIDAAYDVYIETLWTKEETERLTPIVKQLFGQDAEVKINLSTKLTKEKNFYKYGYTYPIPSFASVRKGLGDKVRVYISIEQADLAVSDEVLDEISSKAFNFYSESLRAGDNDILLTHLIYIKDTKNHYYCSTEADDVKAVIENVDDMKKCYQYRKNRG